MIYLTRISKYVWLVQYRGKLIRVRTSELSLVNWFIKRNKYKTAIKHMRYAITKATRINSSHIVFLGNVRINGTWSTQWIERIED